MNKNVHRLHLPKQRSLMALWGMICCTLMLLGGDAFLGQANTHAASFHSTRSQFVNPCLTMSSEIVPPVADPSSVPLKSTIQNIRLKNSGDYIKSNLVGIDFFPPSQDTSTGRKKLVSEIVHLKINSSQCGTESLRSLAITGQGLAFRNKNSLANHILSRLKTREEDPTILKGKFIAASESAQINEINGQLRITGAPAVGGQFCCQPSQVVAALLFFQVSGILQNGSHVVLKGNKFQQQFLENVERIGGRSPCTVMGVGDLQVAPTPPKV